jgi:hypothetical protein
MYSSLGTAHGSLSDPPVPPHCGDKRVVIPSLISI